MKISFKVKVFSIYETLIINSPPYWLNIIISTFKRNIFISIVCFVFLQSRCIREYICIAVQKLYLNACIVTFAIYCLKLFRSRVYVYIDILYIKRIYTMWLSCLCHNSQLNMSVWSCCNMQSCFLFFIFNLITSDVKLLTL